MTYYGNQAQINSFTLLDIPLNILHHIAANWSFSFPPYAYPLVINQSQVSNPNYHIAITMVITLIFELLTKKMLVIDIITLL